MENYRPLIRRFVRAASFVELRDGAIPMMADRCRWFSRVESIFIITDFIRNTKRELYDEKIEDALEMLDLDGAKTMTPRRSATG